MRIRAPIFNSLISAMIGGVSQDQLALQCGDNPMDVVHAIEKAGDYGVLRQLKDRCDRLIGLSLADASAVHWSVRIALAFDKALFQRIAQHAEGDMFRETGVDPGTEYCWVFFGSAARGERFASAALEYGLVYADPPSGKDRSRVAAWFTGLAGKVADGVAACGFSASPGGSRGWCHSLSDWKALYSGWIQDPIGNKIYERMPLFDMRTVTGNPELTRKLGKHVILSIRQNPGFLPLLANDSMDNLPPLTFFQGLVIDDQGAQSSRLDLSQCVLQPLVDIGRVFALANGNVGTASTIERLVEAATGELDQEVLWTEGREGFRVALYHSARSMLQGQGAEGEIDPYLLDKYDQQLLKSSFRAVLELLRFTARHFGLVPRR